MATALSSDLTTLADGHLAAHLARAAGDLLLRIRSTGDGRTGGPGIAGPASTVGATGARAAAAETRPAEAGARATEAGAGADAAGAGASADAQANELLLRLLAQARPDDAVLSEESADDPARLTHSRVWIIDPLDGTREYGEPPRPDWAVHVALALDGHATVGAVALPAEGVVHRTDQPPHLAPATPGPIRLAVSRTRPTPLAERLALALDATLVPMGSAGAKAMAVVTGKADVYAHSGGQYEWDSCAPVAVAAAAGLHVSRLDGGPLRYNQSNPYLPDLLICRPEHADAVLAAVATA